MRKMFGITLMCLNPGENGPKIKTTWTAAKVKNRNSREMM
ncbi:MAG: hypothetical protein K0Q79_2156 [Flavipsychrobacter sp.]|nr:hypothetical protein [Flavipsychrobacter sp.]